MFFPIIYNNDFISIIKVENVGNTWGETLGLCFKKVNLSNLKPTNFIFGVGVFVCHQVCFYKSKVVCSPCSLPPFVSVACFKCFWYCSGESPTCGPAQCDKNEPVTPASPSLKRTNFTPENRRRAPKRTFHLPTIHFSGALLAVSFRVPGRYAGGSNFSLGRNINFCIRWISQTPRMLEIVTRMTAYRFGTSRTELSQISLEDWVWVGVGVESKYQFTLVLEKVSRNFPEGTAVTLLQQKTYISLHQGTAVRC